jgi:hypothetical protein
MTKEQIKKASAALERFSKHAIGGGAYNYNAVMESMADPSQGFQGSLGKAMRGMLSSSAGGAKFPSLAASQSSGLLPGMAGLMTRAPMAAMQKAQTAHSNPLNPKMVAGYRAPTPAPKGASKHDSIVKAAMILKRAGLFGLFRRAAQPVAEAATTQAREGHSQYGGAVRAQARAGAAGDVK